MDPVGRKPLLHDVPPWVDPEASDYFITVCCHKRGVNQLCLPAVSAVLLSSARFYYEEQRWFPSVFLLMPDHVHMRVGFGREHAMEKVIGAWKRYTCKQAGIEWQYRFFEHRLRSEENAGEKAEYILQNPLRAGLVNDVQAWPYWFVLDR